jgi:hypothetical protein
MYEAEAIHFEPDFVKIGPIDRDHFDSDTYYVEETWRFSEMGLVYSMSQNVESAKTPEHPSQEYKNSIGLLLSLIAYMAIQTQYNKVSGFAKRVRQSLPTGDDFSSNNLSEQGVYFTRPAHGLQLPSVVIATRHNHNSGQDITPSQP